MTLWTAACQVSLSFIIFRSLLKLMSIESVNPEYSVEGLMLKIQYFGHLVRRADSSEKTLMLGKIEGRGRRGQQRMRWLDSITNMNGHASEQTPEAGEGQGSLLYYSPWVMKSRIRLSNGTTTHLQFQGWFISTSLRSVLWIVAAHVMGTVQSLYS